MIETGRLTRLDQNGSAKGRLTLRGQVATSMKPPRVRVEADSLVVTCSASTKADSETAMHAGNDKDRATPSSRAEAWTVGSIGNGSQFRSFCGLRP